MRKFKKGKETSQNVSKYTQLCIELKSRDLKMATARTELEKIAGGNRDTLLEIKAEATGMQGGQVSSNSIANISMLIAGLSFFLSVISNVVSCIALITKENDNLLPSWIVIICSLAFDAIIAIYLAWELSKQYKNKTKIKWSSYILIAVDELLASNAFKPKPVTKPKK